MSNQDPVIKVERLSKRYYLGHETGPRDRDTLRDVMVRHVKRFGRKARDMARGRPIVEGDQIEEFWALRDVSFEIRRGDVVGIIGANGAGKSTLLKILGRITEPTHGRVTIRGRVASLLEVGTGFHPELTGRENIFLNGSILGMSRTEITARFQEIVDFAGIDRFLDTPVKRYSSGMYVRLAFAVAAHLDPEILIVDEVLAVGDVAFQRKCLGKMSDVARSGRTVLLVSHNLSSLRTFCSRGILLSHGHLSVCGSISEAISAYSTDETVLGTKVYPESSLVRSATVSQAGDSIILEVAYRDIRGKLTLPGLGFVIHDFEGRPICGHNPMLENRTLRAEWPHEGIVRVRIVSPKLLDGAYAVSLYLGDPYTTAFRDLNCLMFSVAGMVDAKYQLTPEQVGPVFPVCDYDYEPAATQTIAS